MRTAFFTIALILTGNSYAQTENQEYVRNNQTNFRSENPNSGQIIKPELFVNGSYPADLPKRQDYSSDEIYRKVIQGYINTHFDLIVRAEALAMGYTVPDMKSEDLREQRHANKMRQIPISEEEKAQKEAKSKENN